MPTSTGQNWGFTSQTYTPAAQADIFSAMRRAQDVSNLQFQPYLGQTVAGFAPSEIAAMQGIYGIQGYAQPYIQSATNLLGQAQAYADPSRYSQQALSQYYNPYQQDVVNATMANIAQENLRQQNDLTARAIQQGGFGSDRTGIARAELNRLQNLQNAQTLAGLQSQGYQQAQQQYNLAQQRAIEAAQSGAYSLGQLGLQGQQAGLQGLQALMGVGQMERALGQAQLEDQFKRFMTAQGYPWETAQWLASIVGSLGPQAGGTTTGAQIGGSSQTTPGASTLSSILGLGTSALGGLLKLFPGAGAKDGGRINKADGGGFGDLMSLGLEDPWYGFDPQRIDEERKRQWLSRQDVDQTSKQQIKDRNSLNPDLTYDPYNYDGQDDDSDDTSVLRSYGGRTGYKGGGSPYEGSIPYVSGDAVGFIDNLKLPSAPSPHIPKADFLKPPSVGESGGDSFGDIAKSLPQLGVTISRLLSKKSGTDTPANEAEPSGEEAATEEQYGGRVTKADGGGFTDWLANLRGGSATSAPTAPYLPRPQQDPAPTIGNIGDLYKYAFGRAADPEGMKYWEQQQAGGMGLSDIAKIFASSPEAIARYGESNVGGFGDLLQQGLFPRSSAKQPFQTLITTGGAPVVNPDGTPVTLADVQTPAAVQGEPGQGAYSEGDIAAAGNVSGPDPGLMMMVGQNPMIALLINQQQQQKQDAANQKVAQMRAHNASIYNAPRSPIGYFMNLDYSTMSPSGLFGFNPISPYYEPIYPTATSGLSPTGSKWNRGGLVTEDKPKGFDLGGTASVGVGQLPNVMTGHGSQTNPSSFQPGYNPQAFYQQRADGGRTGYARPTGSDLYNYLLKLGANQKEAAMLTGMAKAESNFNPMTMHDQNTGFGLWGHGKDRWADMRKFTGERFPNWMEQAKFALNELRTSPKVDLARRALNLAKSPVEITQAGMHFERPAGYRPETPRAGHNWSGRLANVTDILRGSYGDTSKMYASDKTPSFGSMPYTTLKTRPVQPKFAIPEMAAPKFAMPELRGFGKDTAQTAPKKSFAEAAAEMRGGTGGYGPGIWEKDTPLTAFGETARKGDMSGDVPYAVTMAGAPFGSWDDGKGFTEGATAAAEDERPAKPVEPEKVAKQPAKAEEGPFYGDWRDYEPWKSDPIGGFIDELTGDVPKSRTKGKPADMSSGPDIDLGGLADLFKGFSHGGRAHYADGGPTDVEDLDPELFSPEPMTEAKGFEALADEEPAPKEVVSEDATTPVREAPRREAAAPSGLGNLSSLGDALIAAGFGMMAGRSPNAWQNIGMGGLKGVEAYQSAEAIRARREGELAKVRQKEREAERSRDYLKEFLGAPSAEAAPVRPGKVEAADATTAPDKLGALYDELERYQRAIAMAPDPATASRLRLMQENLKTRISRLERGEAQSIRLAEEARRARKESPEGIIETKTAEDIAKQEIEMGQLGRKSQDTLANLNTMKELITDPSVHTGPLEESKLRPIRQVLSQYTGIGKEGVAKTGDLVARANTMVRDALGGSLGAGVSNADVKFLQSAQVSLGNTPEENKRIVDAAIRLTKLNMTLSKEAENYKEAHGGHLDSGWIPYRDKVQEQFYGGSQGGGGSTGKTKSGINWSVK